MAKFVSFLLVSVSLVACATTYQREGFTGGFDETRLGENVFRVSFKGNGYTRAERATDFALLRSAEVATENGFRYFILVESERASSESTYTSPTHTYTTGRARRYGNTTYGSATTTTYGGETETISKPSTTNTIMCFKDKPEASGIIFDAEFVKKSLKDKYGITD
jgi:hypothetical protein